MTLDEYQKQARTSAIYPKIGENFVYPVLGLVGEAGEVAEKIKKLFRDRGGKLDATVREEIKKELGDVLWYIANLGVELDLTLGEIAEANLVKLSSRKSRGIIQGDGDNR